MTKPTEESVQIALEALREEQCIRGAWSQYIGETYCGLAITVAVGIKPADIREVVEKASQKAGIQLKIYSISNVNIS